MNAFETIQTLCYVFQAKHPGRKILFEHNFTKGSRASRKQAIPDHLSMTIRTKEVLFKKEMKFSIMEMTVEQAKINLASAMLMDIFTRGILSMELHVLRDNFIDEEILRTFERKVDKSS